MIKIMVQILLLLGWSAYHHQSKAALSFAVRSSVQKAWGDSWDMLRFAAVALSESKDQAQQRGIIWWGQEKWSEDWTFIKWRRCWTEHPYESSTDLPQIQRPVCDLRQSFSHVNKATVSCPLFLLCPHKSLSLLTVIRTPSLRGVERMCHCTVLSHHWFWWCKVTETISTQSALWCPFLHLQRIVAYCGSLHSGLLWQLTHIRGGFIEEVR